MQKITDARLVNQITNKEVKMRILVSDEQKKIIANLGCRTNSDKSEATSYFKHNPRHLV